MQNKPTNLREALEQVSGGPAAEKPAPQNLREALEQVRRTARQEPKSATTTAKPTAKRWWERK